MNCVSRLFLLHTLTLRHELVEFTIKLLLFLALALVMFERKLIALTLQRVETIRLRLWCMLSGLFQDLCYALLQSVVISLLLVLMNMDILAFFNLYWDVLIRHRLIAITAV